MFILYGKQRFNVTEIAKEMKYCKTCEKHQLAKQMQSNDAFTLFFIPLIPLGKNTIWVCSECGNDPEARTKTGLGIKILVAIVLLPMVVLFWLGDPPDAENSDNLLAKIGVSFGYLIYFTYVLFCVKSRFSDSDDEQAGPPPPPSSPPATKLPPPPK